MTTITAANSIFGAPTGLLINFNDALVVEHDAFVITTSGIGVLLDGSAKTFLLDIDGLVMATAGIIGIGISLDFPDSTASIDVGPTGAIRGESNAIFANGIANINNQGAISSSGNVAINLTSDFAYTIANSGSIVSSAARAINLTGSGTHVISNSGLIKSNASSFTIASSDPAGIEQITNSGLISGFGMDLGAGNDTVDTRNGQIIGTVELGDGNDTYRGSDKSVGNVDNVKGGIGNDTIGGNAGHDILDGGTGNDSIEGGLGRDTLTGSSGADDFIFRSIAHTTPNGNRDSITDFQKSTDDIALLFDSNTAVAGVQLVFQWKGTGPLTAAGDIHQRTVGSNTIIEGDVTGDGKADWQIQLNGLKTLGANDFIFV